MKDPASDFLLKHQPPEYYKCHLHAALEKEVDEVVGGGERKTRKEVDVTLVMKLKLLDGMECLYLFSVWKAEVWGLSHSKAGCEIRSSVWQYWICTQGPHTLSSMYLLGLRVFQTILKKKNHKYEMS